MSNSKGQDKMAEKNKKKEDRKIASYFLLFFDSVIGGFFISLATSFSNCINHPFLSPLIFSVGILLVIITQTRLITKSVPMGENLGVCLIVLTGNFLSAFFWGMIEVFNLTNPIPLDFSVVKPLDACMTGIIIGCIAWANDSVNKNSPRAFSIYAVVITVMLMFTFVYLKYPHCVVYAFYLGAGLKQVSNDLFLDNVAYFFINIFVANALGGYIIYLFREFRGMMFDYINKNY